MNAYKLNWQGLVAIALGGLAMAFLPLSAGHDNAAAPAIAIAAAAVATTRHSLVAIAALLIGSHLPAWLLISRLEGAEGTATLSFYLTLAAGWLLAWRLVTVLSHMQPDNAQLRAVLRLLIPVLFGVWILILWEAIVVGAGVPFVLLPPPSAVATRMANSLPTLAADVNQTIVKAVFVGYAIGCSAGFAAAIVADRFLFLRRGLLPIGNMVSALPIIGVAPIMVMWFGFDWQSKAAVVVIMTFFPMLVNTVAGLAAAGHMERDLMRTYASSYWQTLLKLRLPAAMPFIFNALKINSTLALIGAIVAEFFGTPVVGMGFRISTEVGRMNVDMVWAEIAVAALAGSVFYGVIALLERAVTFWHPSIRGG
jgi:NitT/TauT family transport system permease protein